MAIFRWISSFFLKKPLRLNAGIKRFQLKFNLNWNLGIGKNLFTSRLTLKSYTDKPKLVQVNNTIQENGEIVDFLPLLLEKPKKNRYKCHNKGCRCPYCEKAYKHFKDLLTHVYCVHKTSKWSKQCKSEIKSAWPKLWSKLDKFFHGLDHWSYHYHHFVPGFVVVICL